jgi:hypothetical protein
MIQRLVLWRLATIERTLDESLGWLAFLARASLRAFVRFYAFLPMTVSENVDPTDLRERIRARHGDEGLVELALAIAAARVIPTTKRALGYATSCSVRIDV